MNEDLVAQAGQCRDLLQELLSRIRSDGTAAYDAAAVDLVNQSLAAQIALSDMIQATDDPIRIEELALLNDTINAMLMDIENARTAHARASPLSTGRVMSPSPAQTATPSEETTSDDDGLPLKAVQAKLNGLRLHIPPPAPPSSQLQLSASSDLEPPEAEELLTPRIDKGKGRAAPEPIVHEKVLTPNRVLLDSEDEDGEGEGEGVGQKDYFGEPEEMVEGMKSPNDL